jgi:hypothetical protein
MHVRNADAALHALVDLSLLQQTQSSLLGLGSLRLFPLQN